MRNLNELAQKIHESNKLRGFDVSKDNIGQTLMLIVGEMMGFPPDWTILPFQNGQTNQ